MISSAAEHVCRCVKVKTHGACRGVKLSREGSLKSSPQVIIFFGPRPAPDASYLWYYLKPELSDSRPS